MGLGSFFARIFFPTPTHARQAAPAGRFFRTEWDGSDQPRDQEADHKGADHRADRALTHDLAETLRRGLIRLEFVFLQRVIDIGIATSISCDASCPALAMRAAGRLPPLGRTGRGWALILSSSISGISSGVIGMSVTFWHGGALLAFRLARLG
jgi:hypothetical protein